MSSKLNDYIRFCSQASENNIPRYGKDHDRAIARMFDSIARSAAMVHDAKRAEHHDLVMNEKNHIRMTNYRLHVHGSKEYYLSEVLFKTLNLMAVLCVSRKFTPSCCVKGDSLRGIMRGIMLDSLMAAHELMEKGHTDTTIMLNRIVSGCNYMANTIPYDLMWHLEAYLQFRMEVRKNDCKA